MLTEEQIQQNKEKFISLIQQINREGAQIDKLIQKLENSDFFIAPASSKYHCAFKGGLCKHSLNVYDRLNQLYAMVYGEDYAKSNQETIIIVSLLHDFSKMNFYEIQERNIKDEKGNWIKVPFYKVKESKDRFLYSDHGTNSTYMVGSFIPLNLDESIAIMHHMGWSDSHTDANIISDIFNRYPLALFLHQADMMATFLDESI